MERILKNSDSSFKAIMKESAICVNDKLCTTKVPILNLALSGSINGGLFSGVTTISGESKRFKSNYLFVMMTAFLDDNPAGVAIFLDSEFGTGMFGSYLESAGVDTARVIHIPITSVEELKIEVTKQLEDFYESKSKGEETPKVMFAVDSIGNLASKKEMDDASAGEIKGDMTRAKQLKSFFRIISGQVKLLNIPFVCVNHLYKDISTIYGGNIQGGGQGIILGSDTIFEINKRQIKDGTEVTGYTMEIKCTKSRFVKENSKFPINITYEGGIKKYSGLADLALEFGLIEDSGRSYIFQGTKFPKKSIDDDEAFWNAVLENTNFAELVEKKYKIANSALISDSSNIEDDIEEVE